MRGLVIRYPWAGLVATGQKTIEVRSWPTAYRGPVAIVAAAGLSTEQRAMCEHFGVDPIDRGKVVCVADLVSCARLTDDDRAPSCHEHLEEVEWAELRDSHFGFAFDNVTPIEPIALRGMLNLFTLNGEQIRKIQRAAGLL